LQKNPGHPRFEIIATDIAEHALKKCREARYTQLEVQRGLSTQRLLKYFKKTDNDQWELNSEIKNMVQFKKQNLLEPFSSLGRFDLVLCRYVLIYQDTVRKKQIIEKIENQIATSAHLVLGASESAMGLSKELKQIAYEGAIFYQKP
jgi:chemotaxis protein methyltransferase CheR